MSQLWIWTSALSARDNILNISLHLRGGAGPPLRTREGGKKPWPAIPDPEKRTFSTEWRGSSLGRGTDPGEVLFPKDFHLFLLSSARRYSLVQRLHQESTILPSTRGIPEVFPFAGTTVEKHGLLLFRTRNSPFSFSLLLLSQDISKKKDELSIYFQIDQEFSIFPSLRWSLRNRHIAVMILRDISQVREIRCIGKANILEFQNAFSLFNLYIYISTSAVQICSLHPARFSVWNGDSVK